ncbi:hypothetical protein HDV05_001508 [Chytridiales sp. JEL 0842]|nr:hypothetical protein HDV05_001508 [Chytridiales sp. JEL 0842]
MYIHQQYQKQKGDDSSQQPTHNNKAVEYVDDAVPEDIQHYDNSSDMYYETPLKEMTSSPSRKSSIPLKHIPSQSKQQRQISSGGVKILPESERLALLSGLKASHLQLMGVYNRLPLSTDTPMKIQRKSAIEKQLELIEGDIKKFSQQGLVVVD